MIQDSSIASANERLVRQINRDRVRSLIADTGAGTRQEVFQLILDENDCLQSGAILIGHVQLGGAGRAGGT